MAEGLQEPPLPRMVPTAPHWAPSSHPKVGDSAQDNPPGRVPPLPTPFPTRGTGQRGGKAAKDRVGSRLPLTAMPATGHDSTAAPCLSGQHQPDGGLHPSFHRFVPSGHPSFPPSFPPSSPFSPSFLPSTQPFPPSIHSSPPSSPSLPSSPLPLIPPLHPPLPSVLPIPPPLHPIPPAPLPMAAGLPLLDEAAGSPPAPGARVPGESRSHRGRGGGGGKFGSGSASARPGPAVLTWPRAGGRPPGRLQRSVPGGRPAPLHAAALPAPLRSAGAGGGSRRSAPSAGRRPPRQRPAAPRDPPAASARLFPRGSGTGGTASL